jgi:hypothetical protein
VYARTGGQAVARATIAATGHVDGEPFDIKQSSYLWLIRADEEWRVVAFEIDQRP